MARPNQNNTMKVAPKAKSDAKSSKKAAATPAKPAAMAGVRKQRRYHPGTVAMRRTKFLQKESATRFMLPRAPFRRIMKDAMCKIAQDPNLKPRNGGMWSAGNLAVDNIQTWVQGALYDISRRAVKVAVYAGRMGSRLDDVLFGAHEWCQVTGFELPLKEIENEVLEGVKQPAPAPVDKKKKKGAADHTPKRRIVKPEKLTFTSAAVTRLLMVGGSSRNTTNGRAAIGLIALHLIRAVLYKTLVVANLCRRSCVTTNHFMDALRQMGLYFYPAHGLRRVRTKKKKDDGTGITKPKKAVDHPVSNDLVDAGDGLDDLDSN